MIAAGSAVGFFKAFIHHCTLSAAATPPGLGKLEKEALVRAPFVRRDFASG